MPVAKVLHYLPTPLGNRGRSRASSLREADLDEAREVVLIGGGADATTDAASGDSAGGLGDHQLNSAERAAARDIRTTHILQEALTRRGEGGEPAAARTRTSPRSGGELVGVGVDGENTVDHVADGDVEIIVERSLTEGDGRSRGHSIYPGIRKDFWKHGFGNHRKKFS